MILWIYQEASNYLDCWVSYLNPSYQIAIALNKDDQGQDPDSNWAGDNFELNGKTFGLFNIEQLESLTKYDFFSNIPQDIQKAIEERDVDKIRNIINPPSPVSLMAAAENELPFTIRTNNSLSVGHNGIKNEVFLATNGDTNFSSSKLSINQGSAIESIKLSIPKRRIEDVNIPHVSPSQIGSRKSSIPNISREQIGISQNRSLHNSLAHISSEQVGVSQVSITEIDPLQVSSSQINPLQISTFESTKVAFNTVNFGVQHQINTRKISFPSFVSSQQFTTSNLLTHNSTPQIINNLNNSATNIWSDLLQSSTQLDIDFQITNSPKDN